MRARILVLISCILAALFTPISPASAAACTPTSQVSGAQTTLTFSTVGTCTWTMPSNARYIKFLLVGGGGGGGGGAYGGGGGGGAVITSTLLGFTPGSNLSITVGNGGAGGQDLLDAVDGTNSPVHGENGGTTSIGNFTAFGGGGGAGYLNGAYGQRNDANGKVGANQGGGSEDSARTVFWLNPTNQPLASSFTPANKVTIFAHNRGGGTGVTGAVKAGAGGGGAAYSGGNVRGDAQGGIGGDGIDITFAGSTSFYGGGGGGGVTNYGGSYSAGTGGLGGGGNGGITGNGSNGQANTGGGGGGAGYGGTARFGGNGGSGLIKITYTTQICIEGGQCAIGDEGPAGGYIFHVDTNTSTAYEAAPRYWQPTCAEGGLCNIGDTGYGGGLIYSVTNGYYRELAPASMEYFDVWLLYSATAFNLNTPYPKANTNEVGRWFYGNVADYQYLSALSWNGLFASLGPSLAIFTDYWTEELDSISGNPYVVNLYSGDVSVSYGTNANHNMRPIAYYYASDRQANYVDDNSWSNLTTSSAVGSGQSNTNAMIASSVGGIAQIVDTATVNGKSDWYVPSLEEMKLLAAKRASVDGMSAMTPKYWTSTSRNLSSAYFVSTAAPSVSQLETKYEPLAVRPIRSFAIASATGNTLALAMSSGQSFAPFRTSSTITATSSVAGKVTFYANGKRISGCISKGTVNGVASCSWRPTTHLSVRLTARIVAAGALSFWNTNSLKVAITSRTSPRS